jgi:hypothetical protein
MTGEPKRRSIGLDEASMGSAGDALAAKVKRLIVDAEHPTMMLMFLDAAIEQYAQIITDGDPDRIAQRINVFKGGDGYVACAKHILLQRAADWQAAEDEVKRDNDNNDDSQ